MERLKKVLIKPGSTIKQALKHMDNAGEKTLVVVDGQNAVLGTVTDGDIRRWILKGRKLGVSLTKVMNRHPLILGKGFNKEYAKNLMLREQVECLPVIDEGRKVISCLW